MHTYYVYILANKRNTVLYIGVTNDVEKRLSEHRDGTGSLFTKHYNVHKLVRIEDYPRIDDAIAREKQLKGWTREKKDALVNEKNPAWNDLSANWYRDPSLRSG